MFDRVFRDVTVVDGTGQPRFQSDVGISDGKIAAVGSDLGPGKREEVGQGRVLAPGFIDLHTHSDFSLFVDPRGESKVRQGVTTEVIGNCGGWAIPLEGECRTVAEDEFHRVGGTGSLPWCSLDEYFEYIAKQGVSPNVAALVGQGAVRAAVMGFDPGAPSADELRKMRCYVQNAMAQGAFGMSSGLYYAPGSYAETDEVVALAKEVAAYDGIHSVHLRDESTYSVGLMAALEEALTIGERSGVRTQVSHLKALGPGVWGQAPALLERLENARAEGLDVLADQYPYTASGSSITGALIPRWAQEGGREALIGRIDDPSVRPDLLEGVRESLERRGGAERLMIAGYPPDARLEGQRLSEVAAARGEAADVTALELLREADAAFVCFVMQEEDVAAIMADPSVMIASDGRAVAIDGPTSKGHPHPRYFGTFPRVLGRYTREQNILTLEQAIHKMTGMPAVRLGLGDRGLLQPGHWADLVLFDAERVADRATFENPKQYPIGIEQVFVNGVPVIVEETHTGERPGRVLRKR